MLDAKGNNRYVPDYDKTRHENLGTKNLYGWVLSQHLPCGGFKWMYSRDKTMEEWKEIINLYDADSETSYIFENDREYLHRYVKIRGSQWNTLHIT